MSDASNELLSENRWERFRERDQHVQVSGSSEVAIKTVVRVLRGVQATHLEDMKTTLNNVSTYTNPLYDQGKRTLSGVWRNGGCYAQYDRLDGNQIPTYNLFQLLYLGEYEMPYFVTERSCRYLVEASIIFGADTTPTLPAVSAGGGITYRISGRDYDPDTGAWTYTVEKRTRQYQGPNTYDSESSQLFTEQTTEQLGVTSQALIPEALPSEDGVVAQRRVSLNEDCSKDATTQIRTAVEKTDTDSHGGPLVAEDTEVTRNAADFPSPGPGADGQIVDVSGNINEFGRRDFIKTTRTAVEKTDTDSHGGPLVAEDTEVTRNAADFPSPGPGADGQIVDVSGNINEFGRRDYIKTTRTAVEKTDADSHGGPLVAEDTEVHRNAADFPSPGPGADGQIVDVSGNINEFGRRDYIKTTRTAVEKTDTDSHGGPLVSETTLVTRNAEAFPSPGPGLDGEIVDVSGNINEFGRRDFVQTTRTALEKTDTDSHGGPLVSETTLVTRNAADFPSPGPGSDGEIVDVSGNINEFGRRDFVQTTRTALEKTDTDSHGGPLVTETTLVTRNAADFPSPGPGSDGEIVDVSGNINEFGRRDFVQTTRTAVEKTDTDTHGGPLVSETTTITRNAEAFPSPGPSADGEIVDVSGNINEFGRRDFIKTTRTAVAKDTGWVSYVDKDGTSFIRVFRNQPSALVDGLGGDTNNSLSVSINEFGLYDGTAVRVASGGGGGGSGDTNWDNFTQEDITVLRVEYGSIQGVRKKRTVTYSVGVKQTTSASIAYGFINNQQNGNVDIIKGGRYFRAAYSNWVSATAWSTDET